MTGLIVDNFAGGGGASTGIEQALGRAVDIAINHDEEAIRMHEVNHPGTRHIRNNIWQIDPLEVTGGQPVALAWFSPDCKHFSKAKGGKPREKSIRDLAWVVVLWGKRARPDVILLENVEEFRTWGPLDDEGQPIKARAGETFDKWCRELRKLGYRLQFRELRACDYGAPTIRKRFFMIARRDGRAIVWPEPTHGKPGSAEVLAGQRLPWRTAAEIIDWSLPCPSIFERKKELADKTKRRIAHGIVKFVLDNPRPFIVPVKSWGGGGNDARATDEPLRTTTTSKRGEHAVVSPVLTPFYGDKEGRPPRAANGADEPLRTQTIENRFGLVEAVCSPFASYAQQGGANRTVEEPLHTVTASDGDHNTVVAATLINTRNGEREGQEPRTRDVEQPYATVTAKGSQGAAVCAFMQKFADNGRGVPPDEPLHTVMAGAPRHAIVCAHIEQANGDGERSRPGRAADAPLSTVTTDGAHQRVVAAHLAQFSETREGRKLNPGHSAEEPVSTIVRKGPLQAVVTSNLVKLRGGEDSHDASCSTSVEEPLHTICATGTHMAEVRAFLMKYYSSAQHGQELHEPLHTATHQARFGLVTVTIEGEEYVIVDIGMRMLTPRELFNAQGFPPDYIIDRDAEGRPITKTAQVAKCGNSVCPPVAEALVRANVAEAAEQEVQAA
jgi:DNA (cytosine-5)-methyltransferase 1